MSCEHIGHDTGVSWVPRQQCYFWMVSHNREMRNLIFTALICAALTCRTLCSGYSRAEELCKEYRQTKGPGTTAKPSEQQFFLKLGGLIKNTLDKCQRENGFMWVTTVQYSAVYSHSHAHTPEMMQMINCLEWSQTLLYLFFLCGDVSNCWAIVDIQLYSHIWGGLESSLT